MQIYLSILLIPISVFYFGMFSPISIVANIIAIPVTSFIIVPLIFAALIFSLLGINIWALPDYVLGLLKAYLSLLVNNFHVVEYWVGFSSIALLVVIVGLILLLLPISRSFRLLGLSLCLVFFQPVVNYTHKYSEFKLHVFDTNKISLIVESKGKAVLYLPSEYLDDKFLLDNIFKKYFKEQGFGNVDYLIVYNQFEGSSVDDLYISKIIGVTNVISRNKDLPNSTYCDLNNSVSLIDNTYIKLLGYESHCVLNIESQFGGLLVLDDMSKSKLQTFYNLYYRGIKSDYLISGMLLSSNLLSKLDVSTYIYTNSRGMTKSHFNSIQSDNVRIFDIYNNGAITIKLNQDNKLLVASMLKNY